MSSSPSSAAAPGPSDAPGPSAAPPEGRTVDCRAYVPAAGFAAAGGCAPPDASSQGESGLFKKRVRNKNVRARGGGGGGGGGGAQPDADATATADDGSSVVRKASKPNPMAQSTARARTGDELGQEFAQPSDRRISNYDNKATATNDQDVERGLDAQTLYEQAQEQWKTDARNAEGQQVYRGQKAYKPYTAKAESFESAMMNGAGPARAPVHYRATSRFDYAPDICKDFKDTGYCGYGDACKFLHDRSDYKSGWQLDKMWEEEQKEKKRQDALVALGEAEETKRADPSDALPFACLICREPWHATSEPVVTKCEHYFCERCAIAHFQKSRRCFVCSEQTGGIFNKAKAIAEKIEKLKAADEAAAADGLTDEQIFSEYEASKAKQQKRAVNTGWAIV